MAATILIADDDAVQRRLVENMVQKCGYEALVVDSGDAAVTLLTAPDAQAIDAVVLDLVMPGLDGIEASALMSYLKAYVEGKLPVYNPPPGPFTIGTNGVGVVEAVGRDVWHLKPGQRVVLSSHFVAAENVEDPAQILIGLTSSPDAAQTRAHLLRMHCAAVQVTWGRAAELGGEGR